MIDENDFYDMLPLEYSRDCIFVHQCYMSLFSGMLNWIGDVLYPRFKYKVITTYDKAVEVFTKKKQNIDGQTQTAFLPALTLDPILDFSNDERAGRFPWMFRNLVPGGGKVWNRIKLTDQGVCITPMFTRYQGTVEVTGWFTSMYDLMDFRTTLIQYCNGYQRWIRPDFFWTHLILPKEIFNHEGPEGKLDWSSVNPEIITLSTTGTREYALPFQLDAIWRLDSFGDATTKMGADQIAEYKCQANFTWECNIPTFIKMENYRYPIHKINFNIGLTPTEAKYPIKMDYSLFTKVNPLRDLTDICKKMVVYNIADENIKPLIKIQDDMCDSYPDVYMPYNHYVCGKVYDIEKLTDPEEIKLIDSILIIDKYDESYLPYIRRCRGLVSKNDTKKSLKFLTIVRDNNISLLYNIKDIKLFNALKSLHGKDITFDVLGKMVYKDIQPIKGFDYTTDISKFKFSHNIVNIIKRYKLKKYLNKEYTLPFGEININKKITDDIYIPCEQFEGQEGVNEYYLSKIVNNSVKDEFNLKINRYDFNYFTVQGNKLIIDPNRIRIKDGDIISLYKNLGVEEVMIRLIMNYKMTRDDELNYYSKKKFLEVDISECRKIDNDTIQCISYAGLMNKDIDFLIDNINKKIIFKIEPQRDCYIQIFGAPI